MTEIKRCTGACVYFIIGNEDVIACGVCGRIKAIRESEHGQRGWKILI
jgi:hypothetical protein